MLKRYDHELSTIQSAVREAGRRVLQLAKDGFETYVKADQSPVTTADLEVDQRIKEILLDSFPEDGWLSEETPDDGKRLNHTRVWVLDPIDGTKYFSQGIPQYAISLALVEKDSPTIAVIFNPATDEFFLAVRGQGATLNNCPIQVRSTPYDKLTLFVNPNALKRKSFRRLGEEADCQPMGSIAYTLALVAAGRADSTLHLGTQNEWDVAAGVLLVQEAGGTAVDKNWNAIRFNKPIPSVPGLIATRADAQADLQTLQKIVSPNTIPKTA
jgi:myo-inositol-1(or 4)-monophosphatase